MSVDISKGVRSELNLANCSLIHQVKRWPRARGNNDAFLQMVLSTNNQSAISAFSVAYMWPAVLWEGITHFCRFTFFLLRCTLRVIWQFSIDLWSLLFMCPKHPFQILITPFQLALLVLSAKVLTSSSEMEPAQPAATSWTFIFL